MKKLFSGFLFIALLSYALFSDSADLYQKASEYQANEDWYAAIEMYQSALKENPSIQNTIPEVLVVDRNNRNDFYDMLDGRYKTHTAKKIQQRIEYVKNAFLNESK